MISVSGLVVHHLTERKGPHIVIKMSNLYGLCTYRYKCALLVDWY